MVYKHNADTVECPTPGELKQQLFAPSSPVVRVEIGALSHPGKVRPNNEDHYAVVRRSRSRTILATNLPDGILPPGEEEEAYVLAVADGMGGQAFGEMASMFALRTAWELGGQEIHWPLKVTEEEGRALLEKFEIYAQLIDRTLKDLGRADPVLAGMGTTLTVAYTIGLDAFLGHIGDSRVYLFREGRLRQLTRDHTLAQYMVEGGFAGPGHLRVRQMHHVLTNCLGAGAQAAQADVHQELLAFGDALLLCTDGLTKMVPEAQISATLARAATAQETCRALVDQALEAGGKDNVTVLLARYHAPSDPGHAPSIMMR
jgi:protein phosphatase